MYTNNDFLYSRGWRRVLSLVKTSSRIWKPPHGDVSLAALFFQRFCGDVDIGIIVFSSGGFVILHDDDDVLVLGNLPRKIRNGEAVEKRAGCGRRKRGLRRRTDQREEPISRSVVQIRSQINSGLLFDFDYADHVQTLMMNKMMRV